MARHYTAEAGACAHTIGLWAGINTTPDSILSHLLRVGCAGNGEVEGTGWSPTKYLRLRQKRTEL